LCFNHAQVSLYKSYSQRNLVYYIRKINVYVQKDAKTATRDKTSAKSHAIPVFSDVLQT